MSLPSNPQGRNKCFQETESSETSRLTVNNQAKEMTDEGAQGSSSCQKGSRLCPQAPSNPYHLLCRHESAGEDPHGNQGYGRVFRHAVSARRRREMSATQPSLASLISFSLAWRFAPLRWYELGIMGTYPVPNAGLCRGQKANLFQLHQK